MTTASAAVTAATNRLLIARRPASFVTGHY
jgi:hypothetical protein